ncbi:helix-turn-helix domain-containing protein [Brevibacterium moorei]|uniref:helix-turn-helix domain-containing protein n=1 Tax=Brevibacterium moorei TaxID=2968457 RepID=UPI00211BE6CE|nr:helix-turn-helix domain-containing protein [Brevibacterium sp. 68QC2CO]MCQ9384428.1 helix-turn-helix domain-containing protein [Brevibacterium sp. 68QC2CO]
MGGRGRPKLDTNNEMRAQKALQLRANGATYDQIAEALGWKDRSSAYMAVKKLLKRNEVEGVDQLRRVALERYDNVFRQAASILNATEKHTEMTEDGVETKRIPTHSPKDRLAAARLIVRTQESVNRMMGVNVEPEAAQITTRTIIVEAETLTNNMAHALTGAPASDDDDIIDVVVDED